MFLKKSEITYILIIKTYNVNWLLQLKNLTFLPMEIKRFTILRAVTTSKHARDQYEIRCFITLNLTIFKEYHKIISPLIFERILHALIFNNKFSLKFIKKEINFKF